MNATALQTGHPVVDRAFRIAIGDDDDIRARADVALRR